MRHSVHPDYLQKYIRGHIHQIDQIDYNHPFHYYECTVTYDPKYWTLDQALSVTPQVISDILKPIIRQNPQFQKLFIAYSIEYLENGYPHIHTQIMNTISIIPEIQRQIHQRLTRRYGRSQWYQTGTENMLHTKGKYPEGILWSEYIKKDVIFNEQRGQKHYYQYQIGF